MDRCKVGEENPAICRKAGFKVKMARLKRASLFFVACAVILLIFGASYTTCAVLSTLAFLFSGGWKWVLLAVKTLPRDIRGAKALATTLRRSSQFQKQKATIVDIFDQTVRKHPDKSAVVFEKQRWTFAQLQEYSYRVANYFSAKGFREGDCVAIILHNRPEYIGIWLGLSRLGIASALINYNLQGEVLKHSLSVADAKAVILSKETAPAMLEARELLGSSLEYFTLDGVTAELGALDLEEELRRSSSSAPPVRGTKSFNELLLYIYTSGTTGPPKAAKIPNHRFHYLADGLGLVVGTQPSDVIYCALPLYHTNGGILAVGHVIFRGSTVVLRKKFSASQFWNDCITYGCTVVHYIGELCRYLLNQPKKASDRQHFVRMAIGNGLRQDFWKPFQERFGVSKICEMYGATEGNAGMVNFTNKVGACGFTSVIVPKVHPLKVIRFNVETNEVVRDSKGLCIVCPPGEPGLLVAEIRRSKALNIDGYESKAATQKKILTNVFRHGDRCFNTGDTLVMDEEGYFYFCDRTGDTFRWKGENVSTFEVESVMSSILENRDVVVYGVEVPGTEGRAGMAAIIDTDCSVDISGLAASMKGRLPTYAVPLFVRLTKETMMTGTIKFKKTKLKEEGYDHSVLAAMGDAVFFLHPDEGAYVPLTEQLFQEIQDRNLRL